MSRTSKAIVLLFSTLLIGNVVAQEETETKPPKTENWSIEPSRSCNSIIVTLPSPALDIGCDLDKDSGNPSSWFNPMASCSMEFDLIGLPTLGDVAAGLVGQVCSELNKVKDVTIDKVIDDINNQVPDSILDDIDINGDINDALNDGQGTTGQPKPPTQGGDMCFTKDATGKTLTVPCSIADLQAPTPNSCYLNEGNITNAKWRPIACNRPTVDYEICVDGYEKRQGVIVRYPDGVPVPTTAKCSDIPTEKRIDNACKDKGRTVECSRASEPETQYNRLCAYNNMGTGYPSPQQNACINVDETCYGHLNGIFKAASCREHTENYYRITQQSTPPSSGVRNTNPSNKPVDNAAQGSGTYEWNW